ncbi:hypothetical protein PV326_005667 [Microctonus aethiopoides]|nr:hypothetical protein PV326_005667 [Microctonus aethiopoides]
MIFVSYSMSTVVVILAVLQTAVTETIGNKNGTNNYDPEKIDVRKGENNTFHLCSGWANPYYEIKCWSAYISNSEIHEISTNSNEITLILSIIDYANENEIVLQNRPSSTYLLMNRKRTKMSKELREKYKKISQDAYYDYKAIPQNDCE